MMRLQTVTSATPSASAADAKTTFVSFAVSPVVVEAYETTLPAVCPSPVPVRIYTALPGTGVPAATCTQIVPRRSTSTGSPSL